MSDTADGSMGRPTHRAGLIRHRVRLAACVLLAAGTPTASAGDTTQFEATGLLYGEQGRTDILEPTVRVTRLYANGQSLSAQLGIDVMTGASPTGGTPSTSVQTVTAPSGTRHSIAPGDLPILPFEDKRYSLDLEWQRPIGLTTSGLSAHFSRETDYQSLGLSGQFSVDLRQRTTTLTFGAGGNHDGVRPFLPPDSALIAEAEGSDEPHTEARQGPTHAKNVASVLVGVTQVLSRRWLGSVNLSRAFERGFLDEPYKVVSTIDPAGNPDGSIPDRRPDRRDRSSVLANTAYHLKRDVAYATYRYYWDDWGVRSHTLDFKYRLDLDAKKFVQPHVRYYAQSAAEFYRYGVIHGPPAPEFVSSDLRLGPLRSSTVGATYGFTLRGVSGEFTVRAEYLRQWGNGHPADAIGVQRDFDLFPAVNIGSVLLGYGIEF